MADYVPNTVVKLLKDVPLDATYTDTRWFSSADEQTGFFSGKAKYTFTDMTYQRVNNGIAQPRVALTCRVPMIADNLYDCNYMMFQNTNYGTKWFYAFVKQVNYINPNNTEIVYEIDYLQTFMFDIQIKPSFVEREHASEDEDKPFANVVPEPVGIATWCEDTSNHYRLDLNSLGITAKKYIVIAVIPNSAISSLLFKSGAMYSGVYSGAYYLPFTSASDANAFIDSLAVLGQANAIADVFMSPCPPIEGDSANNFAVDTGISLTSETFETDRGSYTIRNKKLLNGQFTYIKGTSDSGEERAWLPELANVATFKGYCRVGFLPTFSMYFVPHYMGWNGRGPEGVDYGLNFEQCVHCTWNSQAWLGDMVQAGLKAATGLTLSYAWGGVPASLGVLGNLKAPTQTTSLVPYSGKMAPYSPKSQSLAPLQTPALYFDPGVPQSTFEFTAQFDALANLLSPAAEGERGSFAGDAMTFAMGMHGFEFRRMCPDSTTLKRLDTFFDMFGYQVNKVKQPNLDTRASWNYVKLNTPCIYGSVPVEGMTIIKNAFSHGIRLWHIDAVGDYSAENPPK